MITISLCLTVKNAENILARCLDSVSGAVDEIIIVDTGSDDTTRELAKLYTKKVYDFPCADNHAVARNFSFSKATKQYCMWINAEDIMLAEDVKALLSLKTHLSLQTDIVMMKYNENFNAEGKANMSYYRERIIRRKSGLLWRGAVRESIPILGKVIYVDIAVNCAKDNIGVAGRSLKMFEKMIFEGKKFEPRDMFYYGKALFCNERIEEAIEELNNFLDGGEGDKENNIEACQILAKCYNKKSADKKMISALLGAMEFGRPRAELCCDIGKYFFDREEFEISTVWYELALACPRNEKTNSFVSADYYGFIPYIQLCVCQYKLGNFDKAVEYNEAAGEIKPKNPSYLHNKEYFENNV